MEQKMEQIFSAIVGSDNKKRAEAEQEFEAICESHTIDTAENLLKIVTTNKPIVSQMACLMLQKRILNVKNRFQKLQGNHIKVILETTTKLVNENTEKLLLNTLGNIIVLLYTLTGQFLKFFDYINQFKETKSDKMKIFLMNSLNNLTIFAEEDELLIENSQLFTAYFVKFMQDSNIEVQTAAACAFLDFLAVIQEEKYIVKFKGDLPVIVKLLVTSIKSSEESGNKMLEAINTISVTHPKFVRDSIDSLLNVYCEIIVTKSFSNSLRSSALSNTVNLIGGNGAAVKKSKVFSERVVEVMLNSLTEQDDDLTDWYKIEDDILELSSGSFQAHIIQAFSSLNDELGAKFLMPKVIPLVFKCINTGEWKFQYAGLMTLAMVFTGAKTYFQSELNNFLKLVVPTIKDKHPKVIYASMTCIALLAEEFSPDVQSKHSGDILPIVTNIIQKSEHSKLKLRGISMCISYLRELLQYEEDKECVLPYVEPLMSAVLGVFESSLKVENLDTVEEVLSLISILAAILEDKFSAFYAKLMPGLISLLDKTPNDTIKQNRLRSLILSTMGHMIASYRKDPAPIKNDIIGIVKKVSEMQSTLKEDDSQHKAIMEIYQILVATLKSEFKPFMDTAMNQITRCATRKIKLTIEDDFTGNKTVQDAPNTQSVSVAVDLKVLGGKKILSVNHDALAQKIQAFNAIKDFANILKKEFRPYLEQVVKIFQSHLEEKHSLTLVKLMISSIQELLMVVDTDKHMSELFNIFWPLMIKWAEKYLSASSCDEAWKIMKDITACIGLFQTQVLDPEFLSKYINTMTLALNVCAKEKKAVLEEWGNPKQMDAITREDFEWEYDTPNRLMHVVMTGCMDLMKIYKEKLEAIISQNIGGYFFLCTSSPVVEDEIHYSACFYAEFFLYCSEAGFKQGYKKILPLVIPSVEMTEDCNYQQTASYLIGIVAKRCTREEFQPFLSKSHKFLSVLLNRPDAWTEERQICSETVLGAFGKLCIYQLNNNEKKFQDELSKFLNLMPMKTDPEEAQVINLMFLEEVFEKKNQNILVNKDFEQRAERIVMDMKTLIEEKPELEILSDKGIAYLRSKLG